MEPIDFDHLNHTDSMLFREAWDISRKNHGPDFTFYLPGMIKYGRSRGRYPAISITGNDCRLLCEHCNGKLLEPMLQVTEARTLIEKGLRLEKSGAFGLLLSGGSDKNGRLPWSDYCGAIKTLSQETRLYLSAHTGFPDLKTCRMLKEAGVRQALLDVMGDDDTARHIYHLKSLRTVLDSMDGISASGIPFVPHIVAGLAYGKIKAEYDALELIRHYRPCALVIVVLTPLKGTTMERVSPPAPLEVAKLIARARILLPEIPISLGCERPRNRDGLLLEKLAIRAGANRMAVWSREAIETVSRLGLRARFQLTCCSLDFREDYSLDEPDSAF